MMDDVSIKCGCKRSDELQKEEDILFPNIYEGSIINGGRNRNTLSTVQKITK